MNAAFWLAAKRHKRRIRMNEGCVMGIHPKKERIQVWQMAGQSMSMRLLCLVVAI